MTSQVAQQLLYGQRQVFAKHVDVEVVPVITDWHMEREGAQAGHGWAPGIVNHPIDVLLQQDGHVARQRLEGLPILNDGGIGKDTLH